MKIISAPGDIKTVKFERSVIAIGVFDGVHLGHKYLIRKMVVKAKALKVTSIVITFFPHPIHVLQPKIRLPLIVSLKHRLNLIEDLGTDVCVVIPFTKKFSRLSPRQFIEKHLVKKYHPREVFIGSDFRFGQGRRGDLILLKQNGNRFNFKVNIVPSVLLGSKVISSTLIRRLIEHGRLNLASRLLARKVSILGTVSRGYSRGRLFGFPTANINLSQEVIVPRGVYAVKVILGDKAYYGMANIGIRPSFNEHNELMNVEVYIFNFRKNIYGKEILVEFLKKIRVEKKFPAQENLIQQLKKDEILARKLLLKSAL